MVDWEAMRDADELVVWRGAGYDPLRQSAREQLVAVRELDLIRDVAGLLTDIRPGSGTRDWMEWPQVSFVFLVDGAAVGEVGMLRSGEWVRYGGDGDLELRDPTVLVKWLSAQGVELR